MNNQTSQLPTHPTLRGNFVLILLYLSQVGFSKLDSNDKDMRIHHDSTNNVLGVSYDGSARWRRKTMHARIVIALLTLALTAIIVVLILTMELQLHCRSRPNSTSKDSLKNSVKFLLFSDYHFDTYYDESVTDKPTSCRRLGNFSNASYRAPYGRVGCDSPGTLIDNMLDTIKKHDTASFVLMTGTKPLMLICCNYICLSLQDLFVQLQV